MTIEVLLTNRWAKFVSYYPETLSNFFSYRKPGVYFSPAYRSGRWDGRTKLIKYKRIQAGLFLSMYEAAEKKLDIHFNITRFRRFPKFKKTEKSDRPYQYECFKAMQEASRCGGIVLCATGSGKTRIAGEYFKALVGYGVFVVDELTLMAQTMTELEAVLGEKVGDIGNSKFNPRRISVATVQTLHCHRRDKVFQKWRSKLEVIILDEFHLALNKRNIATVGDIGALAVFGLTATLELSKADVRMRAFALAGPVVYTYPMSTGIEDHVLTPGVSIGVNIDELDYEAKDYQSLYHKAIVKSKVWNEPIRKLVVEGVRRKKSVIVIVDRVAHVRKLTRQLRNLGVSVHSVYGAKTVDERKYSKILFELGELDCIVTNKVFQKGISINRVSVIIDGTSGYSKNNAVQRFGRGVRLHAKKRGLLHFDIGPIDGAFRKAAKSRRRALRSIGIRVREIPWQNEKIAYDVAEKQLKLVLRKLNS